MFASIFAQYIVPILGTGLGAMSSYAVYKGIQWLKSKIKNDKAKQSLDQIEKIVTDVVQSTEQTFVKHLQDTGQWGSVSGYTQAASKAFEQVKVFGAQHIQNLKLDGLNIEPYIKVMIESFVHQMKKTK